MSAVCISRTVASFGNSCLAECDALQIVTFEWASALRDIESNAFSFGKSLQSIAIPSLVDVLGFCCFSDCESLHSVMFERPSKLAKIEPGVFFGCKSLNRFVIPGSVMAIEPSAFECSGIRSIDIEEGTVSFRVMNAILVDFEVRSLVWVIGSPESILIPRSISDLRDRCCCFKKTLTAVEFEPDSNLQSIGKCAFASCELLESICIPSSVEVVREGCFWHCSRLRTVTFGGDSKLRLIERDAFGSCSSLKLVSVPASAEVILVGLPPAVSISRSYNQSLPQ
jgi:hypothetical protein